jgi:hypothetical protein
VGSAAEELSGAGVSLSRRFGGRGRDVEQRDRGCTGSTVGKWRGRFAGRGFDGLHDEPRPGKPRPIRDDAVERVIVKTLEEQDTRPTRRLCGFFRLLTEV